MNERIEDAEIVEPEEQAPEAEQSPYPGVVAHAGGLTVGNATFPTEILETVNISVHEGETTVEMTFQASDVLVKPEASFQVCLDVVN